MQDDEIQRNLNILNDFGIIAESMQDAEIQRNLNRIIVDAESKRIIAARANDALNVDKWYTFRRDVEEIRDAIASGNYDEKTREEAIELVTKHLPAILEEENGRSNKAVEHKSFFTLIMDKIFKKSKKVKDEDNNPIKK